MSLELSQARDGNADAGRTPEKLLTEREAEDILGVAKGYLAKDRISHRRVPWVKLGKIVRYQPSALRAVIDANSSERAAA